MPRGLSIEDQDIPSDRVSEYQWNVAVFRTSDYTEEQLPVNILSSSRIYSIGEEQSPRHVVDLAWSPLGLARHQRSLLAVLTSDHILSFWEPGHDPKDSSSWKRAIVVNFKIKAYLNNDPLEETDDNAFTSEVERTRCRIKAFCWNHPHTDSVGIPESHSMLAVSNDAGEIFFLDVQSPHHSLSKRKPGWQIQVRASVVRQDPVNGAFGDPVLLRATRDQISCSSNAIFKFEWSRWTDLGENHVSILACVASESIELRKLSIESKVNAPQQPLIISKHALNVPSNQVHATGSFELATPQLEWVDKNTHDGILILAVGHAQSITLIYVSLHNTYSSDSTNQPDIGQDKGLEKVLSIKSFPFQSWDPISGMFFNNGRDSTGLRLHVATQLSDYSVYHSVPEASEWQRLFTCSPEEILTTSHESFDWRVQLSESFRQFDLDHDLDGNVTVKTWSLTASPCGNWIVACLSFHPSDMIEYITVGNERSMLAFGRGGGAVGSPACLSSSEAQNYNGKDIHFPLQTVS
ncbi:MAG: hypothetical protein M1833_000673 [Piccolia ochrophora]|nr:MAG: hypothetical protein M1833_000673 [Piccolia ochrophora]